MKETNEKTKIIVFYGITGTLTLLFIWQDTLEPVYRTGDTMALILNIIGILLILVGLWLVFKGGIMIVRGTFEVFSMNYEMKKSKRSMTRRDSAIAFFKAWIPGLKRRLLAAILFGAGGGLTL